MLVFFVLILSTMLKQFVFALVAVAFMSMQSCDRQCRKMDCQNDGRCHEGECLCEKWYSGDLCDLFFNRNYAGVYEGSYRNSGAVVFRFQDSAVIKVDENIPNRLHVNDLFYYNIISDTALIIPEQSFLEDEIKYTVEGSGFYRIGWIRLEYTKTSNDSNALPQESIIFTGDKR